MRDPIDAESQIGGTLWAAIEEFVERETKQCDDAIDQIRPVTEDDKYTRETAIIHRQLYKSFLSRVKSDIKTAAAQARAKQ